MRSFFVILFWAWVAVSFVLLVSRFMGRRRGESSTTPTTSGAAPMPGVANPPGAPARPLDLTLPDPVEPTESPVKPTEAMASQLRADDDLESVPAVAARVDVDTPIPPPPVPDANRQATVAELVQGITMPSDLVPLTHTSPNAGDHVVFMSTTAEALQVGPAIADALEEVGLTIEPVSGNEIIATRPGQGSMHAAIHEAPHTVIRTTGPAFPTAPNGSVVVEFWTGPRPE